MRQKFILIAESRYRSATLHVIAESETDALKKYEETFTQDQKDGLTVYAPNLDGSHRYMRKHWKYDGYSHNRHR